MSYDIPTIKSQITIPELLSKLGVECPDKNKVMIRSPFREEKTPSFSIHENGTRGKDFGGDFSGDVIDLYQEMHSCDRMEAIKVVAEMAGVAEAAEDILRAPKIIKRKRVETTEHEGWTPQWRKFAEDCCQRPWTEDMSSDLNKLQIKKGWSLGLIHDLRKRGVFGFDKDGKIVYIYPHGIKKRWDALSSRGDRWLFGKAKDNLWMSEDIMDVSKTNLFLAEGETDLISFLKHKDMGDKDIACSIPGASWSPSPVTSYQVGSHRDIYLMFDCDKAGFNATNRVASAFNEHATNCKVHALSWRKVGKEVGLGDKLDLGDVIGRLKYGIDNYFIDL